MILISPGQAYTTKNANKELEYNRINKITNCIVQTYYDEM